MFDAWIRSLILRRLERIPHAQALRNSQRRALQTFRLAARDLPAYQALLREHGIDAGQIRTWEDFQTLPCTGKHNTFQRYTLPALCRPGVLDRLASVLTSSGQSGSFAFGLSTRAQARRSPFLIDLALEASFQIDRYKTLLINALPMGVSFPSKAVTVAQTSVREDMVLALADRFGPHYEQIILVVDPLFLKLLCDTSRDRGFDWKRFRVNVILGEETFGEHYRGYVGRILGTDPDDPRGPLLGASLGVGELGLNLLFETRDTIALRRRLGHDSALRDALLGEAAATDPSPMLYTYSTSQLLVERLASATGPADPAGPTGFGPLTITPLGRTAPLPLVRYQTGDLVRLYAPEQVDQALQQAGVNRDRPWPMPLVALRGRDSDELPGTTVNAVKDSLYRNPAVADALTGAFRLDGACTTLHLQLRQAVGDTAALTQQLRAELPPALAHTALQLWSPAEFPFGMRLDYERKFKYLGG